MSERVPCESCKRPMSGAAARCPHCGALQARAPIAKVAKKEAAAPPSKERAPIRDITADEARALIAVNDVLSGMIRERPEAWAWMLKRWKGRPTPERGGYPDYSTYDPDGAVPAREP